MTAGRRGNLNIGGPNPQIYLERRAGKKIQKERPPTFDGLGDPMEAEKWVRAVERIFDYIGCTVREKLTCTIYQLIDEADYWWESVKRTLTPEQWDNFTWEDFKKELFEKYILGCYHHKKENEFWNLKQRKGTVTEYDRAFNQLSRYVPHLVDTDEKQADKFRRGLRHKISISLTSQGLLTYAQSLTRALTIESLLLEERAPAQTPFHDCGKGKRKWEDRSGGNYGGGKRPWVGNPNPPQKQHRYQQQNQRLQQQFQTDNKPLCLKCQKPHASKCKKGSNDCYKCGQFGHFVKIVATLEGLGECLNSEIKGHIKSQIKGN